MKTERELLEAAARAAGLRVQWDEGTGGFIRLSDDGTDVDSWNPVDNEEDAEALRDALGISVFHRAGQAEAWFEPATIDLYNFGASVLKEPHNGEPEAAGRRVTVRAAAVSMPNGGA